MLVGLAVRNTSKVFEILCPIFDVFFSCCLCFLDQSQASSSRLNLVLSLLVELTVGNMSKMFLFPGTIDRKHITLD